MGERYITADDGCRLWTETTGTGPPVVLTHGGPGWWDMFGDLTGMIDDLATVHRWDQRGCGRSERRGPYSIARSVADLDEVRRHSGHDRVTVLGHSWGAELALHYAVAHPGRVTALVYVSGPGLGRAYLPEYKKTVAAVLAPHSVRIDELTGKDRTPDEDHELLLLRASAGLADRDGALDRMRRLATPRYEANDECAKTIGAEISGQSESDRIAACRTLGVPALIVHGAKDLRPPTVVDSLTEALPGAARVVIDDAAHYPWVENPAAFRTAVREFLA